MDSQNFTPPLSIYDHCSTNDGVLSTISPNLPEPRFKLLITRATTLRHFHVCSRVRPASWTWYEYSAILYLPLSSSLLAQAQTPQQRRANERYARQEAAKRGKPESAIKQKQKFKPPISPIWIGTISNVNKAESNRGDGADVLA